MGWGLPICHTTSSLQGDTMRAWSSRAQADRPGSGTPSKPYTPEAVTPGNGRMLQRHRGVQRPHKEVNPG